MKRKHKPIAEVFCSNCKHHPKLKGKDLCMTCERGSVFQKNPKIKPLALPPPEEKICSICGLKLLDNVNPNKIITCASCVQTLLSMSTKDKFSLRSKLFEVGNKDGARSVESFIRGSEWAELETDPKERKVGGERRIKGREVNIGGVPSESPENIQGVTLQTKVKRVSVSQNRRESFFPRTYPDEVVD